MKKKLVLMILSVLAALAVLAGCNDGAKTQYVTVTFDLGYEGSTAVTRSVEVGGFASTPDTPQRNGFVFEGWYLKTGGGDFESEPFDFLETAINEDITLYAKWRDESTGTPSTPTDPTPENPGNPENPDTPDTPATPQPLAKPTNVQVSFNGGTVSVSAAETDLEYSYNDGDYADESTFSSGYAARVKVSVRRKATAEALASEAVTVYCTTDPESDAFEIEDRFDIEDVENTYRSVSITVENAGKYEYRFNGAGDWLTGTVFEDLPERKQQSVQIRVVEDNDYPASKAITKYFDIYADEDNANIVAHSGGGSETTSVISNNTEASGLCGNSVRSIKIEDKDISGYNDWLIRIPAGYSSYSADVKVVVNTEVDIANKAMQVTDDTGNYLGVIELNKWQKVYSPSGNWGITFAFPELNVNGVTGTAVIYLDNIEFYAATTYNPNYFVANSIGKAYNDAKSDMDEKFTITHGENNSTHNNWKQIYEIATTEDTAGCNHLITVKNPLIQDISEFNGISFAINMKVRGVTIGENPYAPIYLVKKGKVAEALTASVSDSNTFIELHRYKIVKLDDKLNGFEVVKITKEMLLDAGYSLDDLEDLTIMYKHDYALDSAWKNMNGIQFYDFLVY